MTILPYILYCIGFICFILLYLPYGLLLFLLLLVIGTTMILVRIRKRMDIEKDYSTSRQNTCNGLLGGIVCGCIVLVIYVLQLLYII